MDKLPKPQFPSLKAVRLRHVWAAALCLTSLLTSLAARPLPAHAQSGPGDLWQTFSATDGLPSGNITAAHVAQDGTLWFGTDEGVAHYDGRWDTLSARHGLPPGRVRAIVQAADGALWFGIEGGGLARRDADGECCQVWTTAEGLPSDDVQALWPAGKDRLWIGTARGLAFLSDGEFQETEALAGVPIWAIAEGQEGELWTGTGGKGMWHRDWSGSWRQVEGGELAPRDVFSVSLDGKGQVWAGTDTGLLTFQDGVWQRSALRPDDAQPRVFSLLWDRAGRLWAGTDQGCFLTTGEAGTPVEHFAVQDGLANNHVRAMIQDGDGALWLGTLAGISRYGGEMWQVIGYEALAGQSINAILTDSAGRTWVGTEGNGLAVLEEGDWRHFSAPDDIPDGRVLALYEDAQRRVWVGTGLGVGYWAEHEGWRWFGEQEGIAGPPVWSIQQDAGGSLWFGTGSGAIYWDGEHDLQPVPEMDGKRINAILRGRDGALWFGTVGYGLFRLAGGQWREVTVDGEPLDGIVLDGLVEEVDGTLWVGTYDRLWQWKGDEWRQINSILSSSLVLSVAYEEGSLWVGTRNGLDRYDHRTWQSYTGSGLPNREIRAIAGGADGTFWLGTSAGLINYVPERTTPWVRIDMVNLDSPEHAAVTVPGGELRAVRLTGGDLSTRAQDLLYLTEVEGYAGAARIGRENLVTYPDLTLEPGTYTLRAWVRDASFNYSAPAEISVHVPPPIEEVKLPGNQSLPTGIFQVGVVLGALALGGLTAAGGFGWRTFVLSQRRAHDTQTRRAEALERRFNPFISGEPVREPGMFFGRDDLLHRMLNALHQNSIMVHGERRIGKTTLLLQMAQRLSEADDPEWVFVPVYIDLEGTPQKHFFYMLMEEVAAALGAHLPEVPTLRFSAGLPSLYRDRDFAADMRLLVGRLQKLYDPRQVRVVLLMDEMDVINGYEPIVQQQLRRIFMSQLAKSVGAVVAGIHISKEWERVESPWYNLFNEVVLEPFAEEEALHLLTEPLQGTYQWQPAALALIMERAQGRPHRLQQYGLEAVNGMLAEGRTTITIADVQAADALIRRTSVNQ